MSMLYIYRNIYICPYVFNYHVFVLKYVVSLKDPYMV